MQTETILIASLSLAGLSLLIQACELLWLRPYWSERGVWRLSILQTDFDVFPALIAKTLKLLLSENTFLLLLLGQVLSAGLIITLPLLGLWQLTLWPLCYAVFAIILICLRWRGTFNGGSDYLSLLTSLTLLICLSCYSNITVVTVALLYLGLQVTLSYFIAGIVKLRNPAWRSAEALRAFLSAPCFNPPAFAKTAISSRALSRLLAYTVLSFECLFPLGIIFRELLPFFLLTAAVFHLVNAYIFGLNRFFWAWLAAYPAVIFLAAVLEVTGL